jgi:hypothetical protein
MMLLGSSEKVHSEGEEDEGDALDDMDKQQFVPPQRFGFFEGEKIQSMGEEDHAPKDREESNKQQAVPLAGADCRRYFSRYSGYRKSFQGIQDDCCVLKVEDGKCRPRLVPLADAFDAVFWENERLHYSNRSLFSENMKLQEMLRAVRKATDLFDHDPKDDPRAEVEAEVSADEAKPKKRKQKAGEVLEQGKRVRKARKPSFQVRVCKENLNKIREFVRDQPDTICIDLFTAMGLLPEYNDTYPSTFDAFPEPFATAYKTFRLSVSHFSGFKEWGFPAKMAEIRAKCAPAEGSGEDEEPLGKRPKNHEEEQEE